MMNLNTSNFNELSPVLPLLSPFYGWPETTADGGKVTYFNHASELSVQIERADGTFLCFVGERSLWQVVGLVVDLSAPWPNEDVPIAEGAVLEVIPDTEPLPDLTLARVKLSLNELAQLKASGDYGRILEAVSMTPSERGLLCELVLSL